MNNELSTEISPEIINSLILTGDMSNLTPGQQTQYYGAVCKDLGLNPLTQPFAIITLQGKKTLYATKGCTQQLANVRKINTEVKSRETKDTVYIVSVRATMPDGRFTDEDGIVGVSNLKGGDLANAMLKAITKAKRRAVLALCGLGMSDETEIEDIPHATENKTDPTKSRIENIVEEATIVKEEVKSENEEKIKPKAEEKQSKESKKTTKKEDIKSDTKPADRQSTSEKYAIVIGLIDNSIKAPDGSIECVKISKEPVMNPNTGVADIKYSFLIQDKRYGTWDTQLAKQIMECIDNRIMVKLEYKERKNEKGNLFNDIVSFKQATADEVN